MNSSTNQESKMVSTAVVSRKILFDKGSEWTTVWFEDFAKIIRMLPESLFKKEMVSVLDDNKNYKPTFMSQVDVMSQYQLTEPEHGKALALALSKETALEIIGMQAVTSQAHAVLSDQLDRCAKSVVSADPEYRRNDELANSDPVVTIRCLKRILITEREGKGSVRKLMTKAQAISDILSMKRAENLPDKEGLVDFRDRAERRRKGLKQNYGLEIIGNMFVDEAEWTLFWVFRLGAQYVQLQRDIENKIVTAPTTLDEAVIMAKDRVEITKKTHETVEPVSVFATTLSDKPVKHLATKSWNSARKSLIAQERTLEKLPPLEPYPFLSAIDYAALPDADRTHIRMHNKAIKDAMAKLEGTHSVSRKPTHLPRDARKEVKFQDSGSRFRVLAITNDELEELEELEPSIVLMSHPQGCVDLTLSDSDGSNHSHDDSMNTSVVDDALASISNELTSYGETPWCGQGSLVPYSDTDSDTQERENKYDSNPAEHDDGSLLNTAESSCSESDSDSDSDHNGPHLTIRAADSSAAGETTVTSLA